MWPKADLKVCVSNPLCSGKRLSDFSSLLVLRKTGRLVLFIDGDTIVYCLHSNSVIISNYLFKYFYRQMRVHLYFVKRANLPINYNSISDFSPIWNNRRSSRRRSSRNLNSRGTTSRQLALCDTGPVGISPITKLVTPPGVGFRY